MKLPELKRLNVQNISDEDCALFMWTTAPQMPAALDLMQEWGFQYKTIAFTWVKHYAKSGKLAWGMGNYTRANPEFVLLGIKGKPQRVDAGVHSVINAPRGAHSAKPHIVNDRIVRLLGDVPRAELFARHPIEGWDVWGDEVECDFELGAWPELAYECSECGSRKIEEQFWVNINTNKESKKKSCGNFWCKQCKSSVKTVHLVNIQTGELIRKIKPEE
jgi:N6-adenosine-specific RNA methylase IME4